jgi:tRNA-Thr(GGU) m(6)t(6)A37 methyltransferase TsaA
MEIKLTPIGRIHSPFKTKEECPIQFRASGAIGRVVLADEFAAGLQDITSFSHVYLLYLFDRASEVVMRRKTFLDDTAHGLFATRHPARPNPIGLSIVRLRSVTGTTLEVEDIDVLDETPLIDLKPYIPRFDHVADASNGWVESRLWRPKPPGRE